MFNFTMKRAVFASTGFHIILFSLILIGSVPKHKQPPQKIYTVRLLSPPPQPIVETETKIEEKAIPVKTETIEVKKPKKEEKPKKVEKKTKGKTPEAQSPIKLDNPEFDSPFYISLIYSKITNNWLNPATGVITLSTTIYFKIRRDGKLAEVKIEKRSASSTFDDAALSAVKLSEPFPPLPDEFKQDILGVHFEFEHTQ